MENNKKPLCIADKCRKQTSSPIIKYPKDALKSFLLNIGNMMCAEHRIAHKKATNKMFKDSTPEELDALRAKIEPPQPFSKEAEALKEEQQKKAE